MRTALLRPASLSSLFGVRKSSDLLPGVVLALVAYRLSTEVISVDVARGHGKRRGQDSQQDHRLHNVYLRKVRKGEAIPMPATLMRGHGWLALHDSCVVSRDDSLSPFAGPMTEPRQHARAWRPSASRRIARRRAADTRPR